jgi:hypothetical protein
MRRSRLSSALLVLTLVACSDEGPVSGPGTLTATLASPNGAEGAAYIVLLGEGIGDLTGLGSTELFSESTSGAVQLVLINQAGGELAFELAVADTTQPPQVVLHEVAGPDDQLRTLAGYALDFAR